MQFLWQTQILEKDTNTCYDALYTIRGQIFRRKEDFKSDDMLRVSYHRQRRNQCQLNGFLFCFYFLQKNDLMTPLEPSFFTRDIQNNIRVSYRRFPKDMIKHHLSKIHLFFVSDESFVREGNIRSLTNKCAPYRVHSKTGPR